MQRYNKAIAAAAVTVIAWLANLAGIDVPAEVQGAIATIAVYAIPNRG